MAHVRAFLGAVEGQGELAEAVGGHADPRRSVRIVAWNAPTGRSSPGTPWSRRPPWPSSPSSSGARRRPAASVDLSFVPALNAVFNGLSAVCLATGWVAIRRKAIHFHRLCMVTAFALSAVFLVGYLSYHYVHGDTRYPGTGAMRTST